TAGARRVRRAIRLHHAGRLGRARAGRPPRRPARRASHRRARHRPGWLTRLPSPSIRVVPAPVLPAVATVTEGDDLLRWPVLGAVLRWRHLRTAVQCVLALVALVIVI